MTIDKVLPYVVVGLTTLLVGAMLGLWVGSTIEQNALATIVTRANLTEDCRAQINRAVTGIIQEYEGKQAPPAE